jgi:hypothetical protein
MLSVRDCAGRRDEERGGCSGAVFREAVLAGSFDSVRLVVLPGSLVEKLHPSRLLVAPARAVRHGKRAATARDRGGHAWWSSLPGAAPRTITIAKADEIQSIHLVRQQHNENGSARKRSTAMWPSDAAQCSGRPCYTRQITEYHRIRRHDAVVDAVLLAALDANLIACREVAKHFECLYGLSAYMVYHQVHSGE